MENEALAARELGMRAVVLRTGYVLSIESPAPQLSIESPAPQLSIESPAPQLAQFRWHAGGWVTPGRAWSPWIHIADVEGLIAFALRNERVGGALNATAPAPVTNKEFAKSLGAVIGHRAWLPMPAAGLQMGLGVITEILTKGKRIVPTKATTLGYEFAYSSLEPALQELVGPKCAHSPEGMLND